jgi:tetratricopeptide (TPR) repeat protein
MSWVEDLADEVLVGVVSGCHEEWLAQLPEKKRSVFSCAEQLGEGEMANELIALARSTWLLFLRDGETVSHKDLSRLCYLLNHPILPCYEMPIRLYGLTTDSFGKTCEERYQDISIGRQSYHETSMIRLFRKDSGLSFGSSLCSVNIDENSTLRCRPFRCAVPIHVFSSSNMSEVLGYNRNEVLLRIQEIQTTLKPHDSRVFEALGMQCLEQGLHERSLAPFSRAVELNPRDFLSMNALGYACMQLERYEEAFRWWRQALSVNPGIHMSYMNIGVLHMRLGQWQKAVEYLGRALAIQPDDPLSHYNLGQCFVRLGDYLRGAQHFQQAIRYDPKYLSAYVDFGCLLQSVGNLSQAVLLFEKALSLAPDSEVALFSCGSAYKQLGRDAEAKELWRRLAKLFPESRFLRQLKDRWPEMSLVVETG